MDERIDAASRVINDVRSRYTQIRNLTTQLQTAVNNYERLFERAHDISRQIDQQRIVVDNQIAAARHEINNSGFAPEFVQAINESLDAVYNGQVVPPEDGSAGFTLLPFIIVEQFPPRVGANTAFLFTPHGAPYQSENATDIVYGIRPVLDAILANANANINQGRNGPGVDGLHNYPLTTYSLQITRFDEGARRRLEEILRRENPNPDRPDPDNMPTPPPTPSEESAEATPEPRPSGATLPPISRDNRHPRPNLRGLNIPSDFNRRRTSTGLDGGFVDNVLNRAFLTEYGVQMFSNFTTNRVMRDGKWQPERDEGDVKADFDRSLTGIPLYFENGLNYLFGAELEFLAFGNARAQTNFNYVVGIITLFRMADNTLYTFLSKRLAAEIKALKAIPVVGVFISIAYRIALVGMETAKDIQRLLDGGRVPLHKNPHLARQTPDNGTLWASGISYIGRRTQWDTTWPFQRIEHEGRHGGFTGGMYYYQWVRLMVIFNSPDVIASRIATLIELNMNYHLALQRAPAPSSNEAGPRRNLLPRSHNANTFDLRNSYVLSEVTIVYQLPHFFMGTFAFTREWNLLGRYTTLQATAVRGY